MIEEACTVLTDLGSVVVFVPFDIRFFTAFWSSCIVTGKTKEIVPGQQRRTGERQTEKTQQQVFVCVRTTYTRRGIIIFMSNQVDKSPTKTLEPRVANLLIQV